MGQKLVTNRDVTVSSTSGNSVSFKKGEPSHVPDHFVAECMAAGAIPVNGESAPVSKVKPVNADIPTGEERKTLILDAIDQMVLLNERGTFNANGTPKQPRLEKTAGFVIDTREITELWHAYDLARKSGAEVVIPATVADAKPLVTESTEETEGVVADEGEAVQEEAVQEKDLGGAATETAEASGKSGQGTTAITTSRNDMMEHLKATNVKFPGNISNAKLKELYDASLAKSAG